MKEQELVEKWNKKARKLLLGKKIVKVEYTIFEDTEKYGLAFETSNGIAFWVMSDDEGNNVGALHTSSEDCPILPII